MIEFKLKYITTKLLKVVINMSSLYNSHNNFASYNITYTRKKKFKKDNVL